MQQLVRRQAGSGLVVALSGSLPPLFSTWFVVLPYCCILVWVFLLLYIICVFSLFGHEGFGNDIRSCPTKFKSDLNFLQHFYKV